MEDTRARIIALERALEEAEATLQAERRAHLEFISLLTHELRVPMTSIKGYADLLRNGLVGPINEPQAGFLDTIGRNVERMTRMVADVSDISKAKGKTLKLSFQGVELQSLLQEVENGFQPALAEKAQRIKLTLPESLPPVKADQERLALIIQRLLENAIQYSPPGGTITVAAAPDYAAESVLISVQDSGIGIPEDEQDRVGDLFFRASDERTRETTGNGLSLHLCHQLLALHGGNLRFESSRERGSAFYVTLPVHTVEQ